MEANKSFPTAVVIRTEIVEGVRKSDGKPFKIHFAKVQWHCNQEQTREIIPLDVHLNKGEVVAFEPIMDSRNTQWSLVR